MTDQELAQEVSDRINAAEAACRAIINDPASTRAAVASAKRRLRALEKAHALLDRARAILAVTGDVAPLSGSPLKP